MIKAAETVGDISLYEPGRSRPVMLYLGQCRVASPAGTETVRTVGELRFVIRFQQQAHHFADQFIRPGWQAERPELAAFFRDVNPFHGLEPVALVAQRIDDAPDLRP